MGSNQSSHAHVITHLDPTVDMQQQSSSVKHGSVRGRKATTETQVFCCTTTDLTETTERLEEDFCSSFEEEIEVPFIVMEEEEEEEEEESDEEEEEGRSCHVLIFDVRIDVTLVLTR
jgi:hypothetical protein